MRLDTGGGKTVILSDIGREHQGHVRIIAHRQELVMQLSLAVARNGLRHNVIASDNVRRAIAKAHVEELGYSLIDTNSTCHVGSIDTMLKRDDPYAQFVTLWIVDEGHHVVIDNKWHRLLATYTHPLCRGLLPTATPKRADGKGLGRDYDGVADIMVQGPPMRWLIDNGYLCDYRVICPPSDLQMLSDVAASGDWSTKQLREAAEKSHIVGDVVESYLAYAAGKLGITFATDIDTAVKMTQAYQLAGVRAETLTGKTDDYLRRSILRQFANRQIEQIVAVDIISEGFDLPAIEVASFARPTESLALYMQQFGRALRTMPGKEKAIILDHVGNIVRHQGPPDKPRIWGLERRDKRAKANNDAIPIKVCTACYEPFEAIYRNCPHCGHYEEPAARASPKMVAGDMQELDPAVLDALRADVREVDMTIGERRAELMKTGMHNVSIMGVINRHHARQQAQQKLRMAMAHWGGARKAEGYDNSMMERAFYFRFGISTIEAVALNERDAMTLRERVINYVSN